MDKLKPHTSNDLNPSLSDAFYVTEEAFEKPYLSKKEYDNLINKSVVFIKAWVK